MPRPTDIQSGILQAFTAGTYLARVTLDYSLHMSLDAVPTSRGIASAQMVVGRKVAIVIFDQTKANDAMIVGVF
ncbi:hypothetical protein LCGC14_1878990 [marine sediment metagenome]|uniref:Uncharacterized protein n=1 Tax=marine sediment metagenome TaxID=412755 RepID=A0A0F9G2V4_9ZZZZ